jgi:uncharacterized metal-binding protein YceD (DUF177 family)
MKKITNDLSDSEFLLELNGMEDEDLEAPIQEAVLLAQPTVILNRHDSEGGMTDALLRKQQEECKRKYNVTLRRMKGGRCARSA